MLAVSHTPRMCGRRVQTGPQEGSKHGVDSMATSDEGVDTGLRRA